MSHRIPLSVELPCKITPFSLFVRKREGRRKEDPNTCTRNSCRDARRRSGASGNHVKRPGIVRGTSRVAPRRRQLLHATPLRVQTWQRRSADTRFRNSLRKTRETTTTVYVVSPSSAYLGVLGLLALGIRWLLLRLGLLEWLLARFFQLFRDLVGRGEFLAFGFLPIFLGEKIVQVCHGDERRSPDNAAGGNQGRKDLRRAGECKHRRAENTLDHGLIMASAVAIHMGLPPPEVDCGDARVKRAAERDRMPRSSSELSLVAPAREKRRENARKAPLATPMIFHVGPDRAPTLQQKTRECS